MHSSTAKRQVKRLDEQIAREQRVKKLIAAGEGFTEQDRKEAEIQEALEMFREFLATEM